MRKLVRVKETNKSKIAQDTNHFDHDIDFNSATVEQKAPAYHKGLFLEARYSNRDRSEAKEDSDNGNLK